MHVNNVHCHPTHIYLLRLIKNLGAAPINQADVQDLCRLYIHIIRLQEVLDRRVLVKPIDLLTYE